MPSEFDKFEQNFALSADTVVLIREEEFSRCAECRAKNSPERAESADERVLLRKSFPSLYSSNQTDRGIIFRHRLSTSAIQL